MEPTNDTCPACESSRLWHKNTEIENGKVMLFFACLDCDSSFREIYNLVYQATEWM